MTIPRKADCLTRRVLSCVTAGVIIAGTVPGYASSPATKSADSVLPVNLAFDAEFSGKPFSCDARYMKTGLSGSTVTLTDYKLFVSNVRLINAAGEEVAVSLDDDGMWQHEGVALLDFEDGSGGCSNGTAQTNSTVRGTVPAGAYVGVAFDVGVPFNLNHADPTLAAPPLNLTSMFWNWRGGYRFMRVDLVEEPSMAMADEAGQMKAMASGANAGQTMKSEHAMKKEPAAGMKHASGAKGGGRGWALHIGSTGCNASSVTSIPSTCASPNRINVVIDEFDIQNDVLVIDPANVVSEVDVSFNTPDTAPGCMSSPDDPECASVLSRLGLAGSQVGQLLISVR